MLSTKPPVFTTKQLIARVCRPCFEKKRSMEGNSPVAINAGTIGIIRPACLLAGDIFVLSINDQNIKNNFL